MKKVQKPEITVSRRATREAIDTQLDLEKMLSAAVFEQARYFRSIGDAFLAEARRAFLAGGGVLPVFPFTSGETFAHMERTAVILAATRVLGRARIRKEVGLPLDTRHQSRVTSHEFAEVLHGVGVDEAVKYLQSLPVATRDEWIRLIRANQGPAFTAAGVENKAALEALKKLLAEGLQNGWTAAKFEQSAAELLAKFQTQAGELRTLWNTVTATAMARGREEMLSDPEVRAIVSHRLYDAILDQFTRPNHRALDGGIAPWDWPGWSTYAPPNGFNCRCSLIGITGVRAAKLLAAGGQYFDLTQGVPALAGPDPGFGKAEFSEEAA